MRLFRHPRWQHLDYRLKVATTQENKPPTQGTRQWTFTTPRWRCGSILLPSLNISMEILQSCTKLSICCGPVLKAALLQPSTCSLLYTSLIHRLLCKCDLLWFMASNDELEHTNAGSTFSLPVFWIGVQTFQNVKGFCSIVELTHLPK